MNDGPVYHIDASYFIFRAYHSIRSDMVDGEGNATHALYGFARFISDFVEQVRPERIGVAFDQSLRSGTSFRNGSSRPTRRIAMRRRPTSRASSICAASFAGTWGSPNSRARSTKPTTSSALWRRARAPPACATCW